MLLVVEFFLAACLLVIIYYKYSFRYWARRRIPFATPSIPWGNYPNPIQRKQNWGEVVVKIYTEMKKKGHKYFGVYMFSQPCFIPIDQKYIKLLLAKDFNHFSYRNFYYNEKDDPVSAHLISLNGDKWRSLRTKMSQVFTIGKIKMIFQMFVECGRVFQQTVEPHCETRTPVNVKDMFSSFSSDVIVNCAFGLEIDMCRKKEFMAHAKKATNFDKVRTLVMYLGSAFPELCRKLGFRQIARSSGDFFIDVVGSTVAYRDTNNISRNDFLQLLINLRDQKREEGEDFTIGEITAQCFIFFLAGYETSATTMAFALYEIAANPHVYDKVMSEMGSVLGKFNGEICYDSIKEMTYLEQVVNETLRLHSPAYFTSRICTKDYYLEDADFVMKKGSAVLIPIRAIHTDPEIYPDPHKFNPERFHPSNRSNIDQYTFLPFGEGPRICIGLRFAMTEVKTALVLALRNYKYSVSPKNTLPLRANPTTFLYDADGGIWLDCEKITSKV